MSQDLQGSYAWQKKGKKYKTKYFAALGQLMGEMDHDKGCQELPSAEGRDRADDVGCVVATKGD